MQDINNQNYVGYVYTDWKTEILYPDCTIKVTGEEGNQEYEVIYGCNTHCERRPHICPVCGGKGLVPAGFYNIEYDSYTYTTDVPQPETCRSCGGTGIVWG